MFAPLLDDHLAVRGVLKTVAGAANAAGPELEAARLLLTTLWREQLCGHFDDEESVLGPLLRGLGPQGSALAEEMEQQHAQLASRFAQLQAHGLVLSPQARVAGAVQELGAHLAFEEREVFAALAAAPAEAVAAAAERLVNRRMRAGRGDPRERVLLGR